MLQFLSVVAALLVVLAPGPVAAQGAAQDSGDAKRVVQLDIDGAIGPATAEYVREGFAEAQRRHSDLIILRLDTPGGLSSSMRDIIHDILESRIVVVAYVSPSGARAASAGTYIVYASHVAAMAPSTHLGAATPVMLGAPFGGRDNDKDKKEGTSRSAEEAKAINDAIAYIRGLAQTRGRNAEWAEKAVRDAATLTAPEAKQQQVIDIVANDMSDLLRQLDGRVVRIGQQDMTLRTGNLHVETVAPNWRTQLLAVITNPSIAYLLLLAGIYGLLFEFFSPGSYFPGVLGAVCLLVGLYALNLLPVSYAGAGLLLLGVALMVAEAFLPTFGVVGIGGIAAFVIGSVLLFRGEVPGFQISWQLVAVSTVTSAAFLIIALGAAWRAHRRPVVTGDMSLRGSTGHVIRWDGAEGEVHVNGERWRAELAGSTASAPAAPGARVRVVDRRGLTLIVEPDSKPQH
jgi:membrane-bound serine protease (ClpP class)